MGITMRFAKGRLGAWVIVFVFVSAIAARADVDIQGISSGRIDIIITGKISARDAKELENIEAELERSRVFVYLNSVGGDVVASIKIGRIVRKSDAWTYIGSDARLPLESKCYSSCALIFIAGVKRVVITEFQQLGLHRPFLAAAPQSREAVEKQVPQILAMIRNYVSEMGVTDIFYQQMINTEPARMKIYEGEQYKTIIPEDDPVWEETQIAWDARRYGVTTLEMRQRKQDAENSCNGFKSDVERWFDCEYAIEWGLSLSVYRERHQRVHSCDISSEERLELRSVPIRLRSENPIIIRREDCTRKIMLGR